MHQPGQVKDGRKICSTLERSVVVQRSNRNRKVRKTQKKTNNVRFDRGKLHEKGEENRKLGEEEESADAKVPSAKNRFLMRIGNVLHPNQCRAAKGKLRRVEGRRGTAGKNTETTKKKGGERKEG